MTEREKNQSAKAWLKRYGDARRDLKRLRQELDELKARQEGTDAIKYSDMPKGPANNSDLSALMVQREKAVRRVIKSMTKANRIMEGIRAAIESIDDGGAREVLYLRYVNLLKWEQICETMSYSWSGVHKLHRRGLGLIYEKVNRSAHNNNDKV